MVGRLGERERLMVELTKDFSGALKVIPIVGMGGIGKTTLAKEIFNDAFIRSHFDVRAWATVSQQHKVKDILVSLLQSTKGKDDTLHTKDESKLADMLQKSLKSRRYLIVLDDMWSDKAWEDVRLCFPIDENRGSRILLTTRHTKVACSAGTKNISLPIGLMSLVESWDLFKSAAFVNEALPSEFETIGKQIVDQCQGLPLAIVVVAGLLSKSKRTIEVWENVGKDVKSFLTNDPDEQCLRVLGLSYNHLRSDLKACLLYFGIFEEDSEVQAKVLMRFWMAEGFLKFEKDLEGVAEKCLQDLVDRCLVLVSNRSLDGTRIKRCKVHDLIYELCLREIQKQKLVVMNDIVYGDYKVNDHKLCYNLDEDEDDLAAEDEKSSRFKHIMGPFKRQVEQGKSSFDCYRVLLTPGHKSDDADNNLLKRTRSIFFVHCYSGTFSLESKLFHFSLLRILDLSDVYLEEFPPQILCLIWLRYLVLRGSFHEIPADIGRLRDLQTFIVYGFDHLRLPNEIWELTQLRHLEMDPSFELPNPPKVSADEQRYSGFPNIHTISCLFDECCTKEVISGIRNVTRLKVRGRGCFRKSQVSDNLVDLLQLEKLSVYASPCPKAFPLTLRKLSLCITGLSWDELNIIGDLPNLEVLKLIEDAVGEEWCPITGGFLRLKVLVIERSELRYWKITNEDFPVLERLIIEGCYNLEKIPIEFAETNSLKLIECSPQLEDSARRIQQEQEDIGNNPVDVRIL